MNKLMLARKGKILIEMNIASGIGTVSLVAEDGSCITERLVHMAITRESFDENWLDGTRGHQLTIEGRNYIAPSKPKKKEKTFCCKYCGVGGLTWRSFPLGTSMPIDPDGEEHVCRISDRVAFKMSKK